MYDSNVIFDKNFIPVLKKYFVFDDIFNLLHYDHDMESLVESLAKLKKDTFEPNYRFIFLHYDTDYHITNQQPGLILTNLQNILVKLDIPNYFCLILSQQHLDDQLRFLQKELTTDDCAIATIVLHHNLYGKIDKDLDINISMITSKYLCLNRVPRFHRRILISLLKQKNLLDFGKVSFNSANQRK